MADKTIEQKPEQLPGQEAPRPSGANGLVDDSFDNALQRFASSFESSARRWELVVYPSLLAFVVLAAYGFFLIYSLTQDMHTLARNVDPQMAANLGTMADHISIMSMNLESMSDRIEEMNRHVGEMNQNIGGMARNIDVISVDMKAMAGRLELLDPISANMATMNKSMSTMNQSVYLMTAHTGSMRRDMSDMGAPMTKLRAFAPW
ncbi:MAG: hypothetical protein GY862_10660 [Gammaproteobacteria bacterium]|nr:hypothetical protein [Gammaproteobacteria bacterium]